MKVKQILKEWNDYGYDAYDADQDAGLERENDYLIQEINKTHINTDPDHSYLINYIQEFINNDNQLDLNNELKFLQNFTQRYGKDKNIYIPKADGIAQKFEQLSTIIYDDGYSLDERINATKQYVPILSKFAITFADWKDSEDGGQFSLENR